MARGIHKTFEVLSRTENEAAVDVLLSALDSSHEAIADGAARAVLTRRSPAGQKEIIRRWPQMVERWPELLKQQRGRISIALREALLGEDQPLFEIACQAIRWLQEYDLLSPLLLALEGEPTPRTDLAASTALELVEQLYQELANPRDYKDRRDPQVVRRHLLASLEQSVASYDRHRRKEVLEGLLLLAPRDNAALKQLLLDPYHPAYTGVVDVLQHSQRGGVMRLLLSYLDDPHPPTAALAAMARRLDLKFIRHVLKKIGYAPSATTAASLKRVELIPWMQNHFELLDQLDDAAQHSAVQMLIASGVKRLEAFKVIEHLCINGTPGGRRAAYEALAQFHGQEASELTLRALNDKDPLVQAAGARQLRQRGIPGSLPRLLELAESRHEVVREAVRESLAEFQFKRFLAAYDSLEEEVRVSTAALVRKIDPHCLPELLGEMRSTSRTKRLRAAELAILMNVEREVELGLVELTRDDDHLVRAEAATALSQCNSAAARQALEDLLEDRSQSVQDTARRSLREQPTRRQVGPPQPALPLPTTLLDEGIIAYD